MSVLLQIYFSILRARNYQNKMRCDKVIAKKGGGIFFPNAEL